MSLNNNYHMGVVKNYIIERDEILGNLNLYLDIIKKNVHESKFDMEVYNIGLMIVEQLDGNYLYFQTVSFIEQMQYILEQYIETIKSSKANNEEKQKALIGIKHIFHSIHQKINEENKNSINNYNSEKYYKTQIATLEKREKELNEKISMLEPELSKTQQQRKEAEIHLKELATELSNVKQYMQQVRQEQDEQKRRQDAQEELKTNIKNAFNELNEYSTPIETEKRRLNCMFIIYALLSIVTLTILIVYEYKFIGRFNNQYIPNTWIGYLPFYLPVPLCAGLLWVFIFQMNRAQRQLILLTDKLHHIKYIEGLLLAINTLSLNPSDGALKIQQTINSIIDNYLRHQQSIIDPQIQKELSQDQIDLKLLTDFIREIKGLTHK